MHCAHCGNKLPLWTGYVFRLDGGYWCNACRNVSHAVNIWAINWVSLVVVALVIVYVALALFLNSKADLPRSIWFAVTITIFMTMLMPMRMFLPHGVRIETSLTPQLRRARRWRTVAGLIMLCAYFAALIAYDFNPSSVLYLGVITLGPIFFCAVVLWSFGHEPMVRDDT